MGVANEVILPFESAKRMLRNRSKINWSEFIISLYSFVGNVPLRRGSCLLDCYNREKLP